jgi:hypothetical protein
MGQISSELSRDSPSPEEVINLNRCIIDIATKGYNDYPYELSQAMFREVARMGYTLKLKGYDFPWYEFYFMHAVADPELTQVTKEALDHPKNSTQLIPASQAKYIFNYHTRDYLVERMAVTDFIIDPFARREKIGKLDDNTCKEIMALLPENIIIDRKPDGQIILWKRVEDPVVRSMLPTIISTTSDGLKEGKYLVPPPEVYSDRDSSASNSRSKTPRRRSSRKAL